MSYRAKLVVPIAAAFVGGVIFASSMDFTKYSWAQPSKIAPVAQPAVRGPNSPDAAGSFANVAEKATPAVVAVNTIREARQVARGRGGRQQVPQGMDDFLRQFGGQIPQQQQQEEMRGEGSGFIVSPDGYIITNNHVVADADRVTVTLSDRRVFAAKVVGRDSTTDVAVVKIDAKGLPTLPIGNEDNARIGDWVLAVGNPLGLDFTVTAGIISAKARGSNVVRLGPAGSGISDYIQTDAAINPGNSGGPLINLKGEAIGLNAAIASETGYYSGYGFAIPITLVKQVADQLIKDGKVRLPMIGVSIGEPSPEDAGANKLSVATGAVVEGFGVSDNSPGKDAGILQGDLIVAIAGQPVDRVSALQRIVRSHAVGEVVQVDVLRFGEKKSFKVKLGELAAPKSVVSEAPAVPTPVAPAVKTMSKIGITIAALPPEMAQQAKLSGGVRVTAVENGGPARDKLIPDADVITEVLNPGPRHAVTSTAELQKSIDALKSGDYLSLMVTTVDPRGGTSSRVVNLRAN